MTRYRKFGILFSSIILLSIQATHALGYDPPSQSKVILAKVDFPAVSTLDEDYRQQFVACDRGLPGVGAKDHFRGHNLRLPGKPESKQYYLCSRDPSRVAALLKLKDGAIYWHSKMALDVDGSWAAWNGIPGATDLKQTSYKWPDVGNKASQAAQIDPDRFPFVVMPMSGIEKLTGSASGKLGREFAEKTGLKLGDMGVVVYKDKWVPVFIADGGPFMRLGEGSSRVFEAIGQSRCKKWSADGLTCIGNGGGAYPYRNFGIGEDVIFILYPGSRDGSMTAANALDKLCAFAKSKLDLSGGAVCP